MSTDSPGDGAGKNTTWYGALSPDELPEGRVTAVSCGETTVAEAIAHDGPALVEILTDSDPV